MKKLIAVLIFLPTLAYADFWSGNMLHQRLQSTDGTDRILALGYVMGISDAYDGSAHCSGQSVTAGQTRDVVKLYLEQNPAVRDMNASIIVMVALGQAFPCPKDRKKNSKS